jgi:hypothetical protein
MIYPYIWDFWKPVRCCILLQIPGKKWLACKKLAWDVNSPYWYLCARREHCPVVDEYLDTEPWILDTEALVIWR